MLQVGSIPKKISYVYSDSEEVSYGSANIDKFFIPFFNKITVYPTYVVDAESKNPLQNAIKWAKRNTSKEVVIDTLDNNPIDNIKILSLDVRKNGGRAYKVLIDDKYYVDFREDALLDSIFEAGINSGGKLNGQYIWAHQSSQFKLIKYNSQTYNQIIKSEELKKLKVIKDKMILMI
jgi:hypothetical protein